MAPSPQPSSEIPLNPSFQMLRGGAASALAALPAWTRENRSIAD